MEPTLGMSLSTDICNQRSVNLHFNQHHVCWKAPYISVHVCFRKVISDFTIFENRISTFFSFLDYLCLTLFLFISCLITFWKPFETSSVMICWLSNGEGPLGGGGQHYKPSVVGGGGRLRNKNLAGGVAEEMTGLPKHCPAPAPTEADK